VSPILRRLCASAGARERARDYAFSDVRALAEQRITLVGIAAEDGGAGGSLRDVADLVLTIARADSNVAQPLRASFLTANRVAARRDLLHREVTLRRLRAGDLFTGTSNERTGGASGSVSTTIRREGDGFVINGEKYYSTGGLYASWFSG
jgi:alkylation response protein AidB-like acyl-CoA dehydrogenase